MAQNDPKSMDGENKQSAEEMLAVLRGISGKNETAEQGTRKFSDHMRKAAVKSQK